MEDRSVTGKKLPPHATTGFGITDGNGVCINPLAGEMLKGKNRLLEIVKIEKGLYTTATRLLTHIDVYRECYHLLEYNLPEGWLNIATTQDRLQSLKNTYPREEKKVPADVLEDLITGGKLTWWWVVDNSIILVK